LIGQPVTTVRKSAQCILTADRIERLAYGFYQSLLRAGLDALRKMALIFEKASSIGEKSGE